MRCRYTHRYHVPTAGDHYSMPSTLPDRGNSRHTPHPYPLEFRRRYQRRAERESVHRRDNLAVCKRHTERSLGDVRMACERRRGDGYVLGLRSLLSGHINNHSHRHEQHWADSLCDSISQLGRQRVARAACAATHQGAPLTCGVTESRPSSCCGSPAASQAAGSRGSPASMARRPDPVGLYGMCQQRNRRRFISLGGNRRRDCRPLSRAWLNGDIRCRRNRLRR